MLPKQRRISTVLATRISGYSGFIASTDESVQKLLGDLHDNFVALVSEFDGNLISRPGRDLEAEFPSAVNAICAAVRLQNLSGSPSSKSTSKPTLQLRTGLHLGEILIHDEGVVGDALDISASLRNIAKPGEIIISSAVHEQLEGKVDSGFVYSGKHAIEKLLHPVSVYRVVDRAEKKPIRDVLSELFRRRIFRSAGAYFVAAWLLVQASDTILPVFNTPSWVLRSIIILLIVGFPLAMLMTWSVNLSADGLVKTADSGFSRRTGKWLKFSVVSVAIVISASILWSIRSTVFEPPAETRVNRSAIKSQPVIAVAELTKRVGDASLDWLGQGIANLLRDSMADSPLTVVYSLAALQSLNSETDSSQNFAQTAKEAGVDYMIAGDYMSTASGIVISVHIEDLSNGTIIPGDRIEATSVEEALAGTTQLIRRLKQSLNLPYVNQVGHLAADFAAENPQAYELYVSGLDYLAQFDYENAENLMQAAIDEAPQFGIARYRLSQILEAIGRNREAFQVLNTIQTDTLTEREQLYVAGAKYLYSENRDTKAAIAVFLEAVANFPFDSEAHQNLAEAYWFDFQNAASINQLENLVTLHPQEAVSWMALGERQLEVRDVDGAHTSLAKYVSMRPDDPYPHALLGQLAGHEGRYSEARTHYQQALIFRPGMGIPEIGLARLAYFEGNVGDAISRWQKIIGGTEVAADYRIDAAFDLAYALRALGRPQNAFEILALVDEEIRREGFREALSLTTKAEVLVDLGELPQARDYLVEAIDKTPASRQPTRPYFHLALISLQENDRASFSDIVEKIRTLPAEPGTVIDNDRIAAIHYLMGVSLLGDDPTAAASAFEKAINTPDHFPYRLYELGLAEARMKSGDSAAATAVLDRISEIDPANPRFDLEYDRRLKLILEAEALAAAGRTKEARDLATQLSARWPDASAQHPAMQRLQHVLTLN